MVKLVSLSALLWILLFTFRVTQIGGIDPTFKDPGIQLFEPLRNYLSATIDSILPFPENALLSGILLGNQSELPYYFKQNLQITSTIHIVVVSGQNLTMLAGFIMYFASHLGRRKTIALTLTTIIFYSFLTGFGVPVIRAAIMVSFAYVGKILGKETTGWWILVLTGGLMLLYQPNWLLSVSFQLSFLATLGVVVISPILAKSLKVLPSLIKEDLAVTLSAQAMVLPILAYNFGRISFIGVLSNLLILWTIPIVMISGFTAMILGIVNQFLGQIAGLIPGILLTYFVDIVDVFSKVPGASIKVGETGMMMWIGYYLMLGAIIFGLSKRQLKS